MRYFSVFHLRGNVVTMECFEKVIKKDMIDPTNGKQLTEKDVIPLQRVRCTSHKETFPWFLFYITLTH